MVNSRAKRGSGFRGVLDYLCDHDSGHCIGGNMSSTDPRDLAHEFGVGRRARPDVRKPVWHMSLRLPAGEKLSEQKWVEIADAFASDMEFTDKNQRAYFIHNCEAGQHIHIVCNRIGLDGSLWYGQDENLKATKICQNLETRFSLTLTQKPDIDVKTNLPSVRSDKKRRTPKKPEIDKACRTLTRPGRIEIADLVDKALLTDHPKTPEDLKACLSKKGVEVEFFVKDGETKGITFFQNGLKFAGSSLGPDYKFPAIIARMKHDTTTKTSVDPKPSDAPGNVPGHPYPPGSQPTNSNFDKKGLAVRKGRRATKDENKTFQLLTEKGKIMNDAQEMIGALSHARTIKAEDPLNIEHGWNEYTDHVGRIWFYEIGQPPRPGNRAGYSWDPAGNKDGPPAIRVWDCAVERHGVEQAAIDAVRICVFKSLPEPLRLHGTPEFQKFAAREMHRRGLELQNQDGPGRIEYDRLEREKEKGTQDRVNSISATFAAIDHQAKANHRDAVRRAADSEDQPTKKDDRMRIGGPKQ